MMNPEEFKNEIANVLGISPSELSEDAGEGVTELWDSMATLNIISYMESKCGDEISADDSDSFSDYKSLLDFAKDKKVVKDI